MSDVTPASSRLRASLLRTGPEPVTAFRLIPFGRLQVEQHEHDCEFDRQQGQQIVDWFERLGRRLAIDYEHQTYGDFNERSDGLAPAAGWIGRLELRDDGLWADEVEWTERAVGLLRSGEYRYFSPVLMWRDGQRREIAALGPVALTNDPAMHAVAPLVARRSGEELSGALQAARQELHALQDELRTQRSERFVEEGIRSGKILGTTRDGWQQMFLHEPRLAHERLRQAPVLLPPGQQVPQGDGPPPRLAEDWIEPADLVAYERVAGAGYVRLNGKEDSGWH